jgi:hypothetical protein
MTRLPHLQNLTFYYHVVERVPAKTIYELQLVQGGLPAPAIKSYD